MVIFMTIFFLLLIHSQYYRVRHGSCKELLSQLAQHDQFRYRESATQQDEDSVTRRTELTQLAQRDQFRYRESATQQDEDSVTHRTDAHSILLDGIFSSQDPPSFFYDQLPFWMAVEEHSEAGIGSSADTSPSPKRRRLL